MATYSILYRRRRDESGAAVPSRERNDLILVSGVDISANAADRIAKNILDDFRDVVDTAWAERD